MVQYFAAKKSLKISKTTSTNIEVAVKLPVK